MHFHSACFQRCICDVVGLSAQLVVVINFVVLNAHGGSHASDTLQQQYGVFDETVKCDSSKACPRWMYCDDRNSVPECSSCDFCYPSDANGHTPCELPVMCVQSHRHSNTDKIFCPAIEIVDGELCRAMCRPLRTLSGYPLGTQCSIYCAKHPDLSTKITCSFNNSVAHWNSSLPPVVQLATTQTTHSFPGLLPSTVSANETRLPTTQKIEQRQSAIDAVLLSVIVLSAVIGALLTSLLTTLVIVRRRLFWNKEVSSSVSKSSESKGPNFYPGNHRGPTATENMDSLLPNGEASNNNSPEENSDVEYVDTQLTNNQLSTLSPPPGYSCCLVTEHPTHQHPCLNIYPAQESQQQQQLQLADLSAPNFVSLDSFYPTSTAVIHQRDVQQSSYCFNPSDALLFITTDDCNETLCKLP